jgi:hypothetical protein
MTRANSVPLAGVFRNSAKGRLQEIKSAVQIRDDIRQGQTNPT